MGAQGTATLNFGAAPGTNYVSVAVTGQVSIVSGASLAEAWMMASSTGDHNAIEHSIIPIKLTCGDIVTGTGFTIYAFTELRLTGTFSVQWVWN
jgi:hypothetical protein